MRTHTNKLVGLVTVAAALLGACGDSNNNTNNNVNALACTANTKECVGDRVARQCPADGSNWLIIQCGAGEVCMNGDCVSDGKPVACTSDENRCMSDTVALRCSAAGAGFDSITCPTDTHCTGAGLCVGSCVVGSSLCTGLGSIATCTDGKSYTVASCGTDEYCVTTSGNDDPMPTAACKVGDCKPDPKGCNTVCGNKVDSTATQTTFVSECVETPDGYKWRATGCLSPQTCDPSAGTCLGGTMAACSSECTPGDMRCAAVGASGQNFLTGYQTCTVAGRWEAGLTPCNASPTAVTKTCFTSPVASNKVVCGDPACARDKGSCDAAGQFHACDNDGNLSATGVTCDGICLGTSPPVTTDPGKLAATPGHCTPECEPGDQRCTDAAIVGSSLQVCGTDKKWGPVQTCAGGDSCMATQNGAGRPRVVCGVCFPGQTRCSDMAGNSAPAPSGYVQTCQANGTWGAASACAIGVCQQGPDNRVSCLADCAPGDKVCIGANKAVAGSVYSGTDTEGVCTAEGKLPTMGTACSGAGVCRKGPHSSGAGGQAIGCTVCVGTANEYGLVDTRCTDMNGNAGTTHVQTCQPDGTAWAAGPLACMAPNPNCGNPSTNIPAPHSNVPTCFELNFGGSLGVRPVTDSNLRLFNPAWSCASIGLGPASSCGLASGETVNDCCAIFCEKDPQPTSAACNP